MQAVTSWSVELDLTGTGWTDVAADVLGSATEDLPQPPHLHAGPNDGDDEDAEQEQQDDEKRLDHDQSLDSGNSTISVPFGWTIAPNRDKGLARN